MKEINTQTEKGILPCRKDTSVAVWLQDKKYLEDLKKARGDKNIQDTIHHMITVFGASSLPTGTAAVSTTEGAKIS